MSKPVDHDLSTGTRSRIGSGSVSIRRGGTTTTTSSLKGMQDYSENDPSKRGAVQMRLPEAAKSVGQPMRGFYAGMRRPTPRLKTTKKLLRLHTKSAGSCASPTDLLQRIKTLDHRTAGSIKTPWNISREVIFIKLVNVSDTKHTARWDAPFTI